MRRIVPDSPALRKTIAAHVPGGKLGVTNPLFPGAPRLYQAIGPDGKIVQVWRGVKVPGHAAAVLEALKNRQ